MNRILLSLLLLVVTVLPCPAAEPAGSPYAVAVSPTPVLNTADFRSVYGGRDGRTLQRDASGLVRAVEFVALPGTPFRVEATLERDGAKILRVTTPDYPCPDGGCFVDSRFVVPKAAEPPPRQQSLPDRASLRARLLDARGSRYVWGGNVREGIPEMLVWYPPPAGSRLDAASREIWQLKGLDCSGLLYEATGGYTPRNTSDLVRYGKGVAIGGRTAREIARKLEPYDLIVWPGHVLIVLDGDQLIESSIEGDGVRVRPLERALAEIMRTRDPLDEIASGRGKKGFVVRRWYPR